MNKNSRNILIGAGVIVAGMGSVAAASHAIMKKLVGIAMDRPEPEIIKTNKHKLTGAKRDSHLCNGLKDAEEALASSDCETVEVESHDGLRLTGHWHIGNAPKRVIIAMHGWRSGWAKDFGAIAPFWHGNDCAVLYAEQRSQGNSEGEYITFGMLERYDCLRWIDWVNACTGGMLPVYLAGVSMGATTVLMTAADELPENVRGIIADCGFTSTYAIWHHVVGDNLHIPYNGLRAYFADQMCRSRVDVGPADYSTVDALQNSKVPVLLIHGEKDSFVPVSMTYENYEACRTPKYLFVVPEAGHGMSYVLDQEGYKKAVEAFWSEFDEAATESDFEAVGAANA